MKKQSGSKLAGHQQKLFYRLAVVAVVAAVLWLLFSPVGGLWHMLRQGAELDHTREQVATLEEENRALSEEIDKLNNDVEYLEKVAREDYGLLKKNEKVFDFTRETGKTEKED